jgi:hypothetical protein
MTGPVVMPTPIMRDSQPSPPPGRIAPVIRSREECDAGSRKGDIRIFDRPASLAPMTRRSAAAITIYLSPSGDDRWSGTLPEVAVDGRDGPLRSPTAARDRLRALRSATPGVSAEVLLRGGTYELDETMIFDRRDGGSERSPVVWSSYPGERAVLSGGRRLTGFVAGEMDGKPCWTLDLPEVRSGWYFHQLWRHGQRLDRPRLPTIGTYRFAGFDDQPDSGFDWRNGPDRAEYHPGDLRAFRNLDDVKLVALQLWFDMHLRPVSVDHGKRLVRFARRALGSLRDEKRDPARYWVENVREAILPGQWYLDRAEARLYYLPLPGERLDAFAVVAGRLPELVRFADGVAHLHLQRLDLCHNDWERDRSSCGVVQAAYDVPGAVVFAHAERCALYACRIGHLGTYAVEVQAPSHANTVAACVMHDLGAGGVKIGHEELAPHEEAVGQQVAARSPLSMSTIVADCTIRDGGHRYPSAIGIWIGNSGGNRILRNEIHRMRYTGISCGWTWGYQDTRTVGNRIEANHIHHINHDRLLSDNGGIYTLGRHPGSTICGNHIHDISCYGYGGWGIYLDEGSSEFVIDGNLVHGTRGPGLFLHYGRANVATRNILCAGDGHFHIGRCEAHRAVDLDRNLVLVRSGEMQAGCMASAGNVRWQRNLFWDERGMPVCAGEPLVPRLKDRQHAGLVVADPLIVDAGGGDFRLHVGSPARSLGLTSPDPARVGPRRAVLPIRYADWRVPAVRPRPAIETSIAVLQEPIRHDDALVARLRIEVRNRSDGVSRGRLRVHADGAQIDGVPSMLRLVAGTAWEGIVTIRAPADRHAIPVDVRAVVPGAAAHHLVLSARPTLQIPRVAGITTAADAARLLAVLPARPLLSPKGDPWGEVRLGLSGDALAISGRIVDTAPTATEPPWSGSVVEIFAYADERAAKGQVFLVPGVHGAAPRLEHLAGASVRPCGGDLSSAACDGGWNVAAVIPASALGLLGFEQPFLLEIAASGAGPDGAMVRSLLVGASAAAFTSDGCATVAPIIIPGLS